MCVKSKERSVYTPKTPKNCWAVRALRVVKKKKVLRVGSCSGNVISL